VIREVTESTPRENAGETSATRSWDLPDHANDALRRGPGAAIA
jgi:hypothetical protein